VEHETKVRWVKNWQFVGTDSSGHSLVMDSPKLGENSGVQPVELLLLGLAGCMGMDVVSILFKKQQKLTGFEMRVGGDRRSEHPRSWTHIHIEFIARGWNLDPQAVERAVELSETKYCSAYATLRPTVEITRSITIEQEQ